MVATARRPCGGRPLAQRLHGCCRQCSPRAVVESCLLLSLCAGAEAQTAFALGAASAPARCRRRRGGLLRFRCLPPPGRPGPPILRRAAVPVRRVSLGLGQTAVVRRPLWAAAGAVPVGAVPVLNPPARSGLFGRRGPPALRFGPGWGLAARLCGGRAGPPSFLRRWSFLCSAALGSVVGGPGRGVWPRWGPVAARPILRCASGPVPRSWFFLRRAPCSAWRRQ